MIQYIRNLEICSLSLSPSLSKLLSKFFEKKKSKSSKKIYILAVDLPSF